MTSTPKQRVIKILRGVASQWNSGIQVIVTLTGYNKVLSKALSSYDTRTAIWNESRCSDVVYTRVILCRQNYPDIHTSRQNRSTKLIYFANL
jgi:hypothetical protein